VTAQMSQHIHLLVSPSTTANLVFIFFNFRREMQVKYSYFVNKLHAYFSSETACVPNFIRHVAITVFRS
jgi:hypothetical protein